MTGAEVVGATVAKGLEVTGKALAGGEREQEVILEGAKDTPGYRAAALARGDRMAVKQLAINRVLSPLFWFAGYRRDYFESGAFAEDMAETLGEVSEEDLVAPSPNVAAQAMEGLSYSLDEPDLKAMYLNLLATASHKQRRNSAHPSFAEVIRQLSQEEASLLPLFLSPFQGHAIVQVRATREDTGEFRVLERHVAALSQGDPRVPIEVADWAVYVDNWVRLGLVGVDYDARLAEESQYEFVDSRPEFVRSQARTDLGEGFAVTVTRGMLMATNFGLRFAAAVISLPGSSDVPSADPPGPDEI